MALIKNVTSEITCDNLQDHEYMADLLWKNLDKSCAVEGAEAWTERVSWFLSLNKYEYECSTIDQKLADTAA